MAVYRFRVSFEEEEDVYREIDIRSNQTFGDLHAAIQNAIKFDDSKQAAFYHTDSNWRKDEEIVQIDKKPDSKSKKLKLAAFVEDPHQRFLYLFDFKDKWLFYVEMIKILQEQAGVEYPKCIKVQGVAPLQYKPVLTPEALNGVEEDDQDDREPTREELVYESDESLDEKTEKDEGEEGEESGEDGEGEGEEEASEEQGYEQDED
jgi:hypothetical protein